MLGEEDKMSVYGKRIKINGVLSINVSLRRVRTDGCTRLPRIGKKSKKRSRIKERESKV